MYKLYLKTNRYNNGVRFTCAKVVSRSRSSCSSSHVSSASSSPWRAVRKFREYAYNNEFSHFGTITISPSTFKSKFNCLPTAENAGLVRSWLTSVFNQMTKNHSEFKFLCVPEFQENGNIHLHGFFKISSEQKMKTLGKRYFVDRWLLSHVGLNRFEPIGNRVKAVGYCTKYILKNPVDVFSSFYFCSRGLLSSQSFSADVSDDIFFRLCLALATSSLSFKLSHSDFSVTFYGSLPVLIQIIELNFLDELLIFVIFHLQPV